MDSALRGKRRRLNDEQETVRRLNVASTTTLPSVWKGKAYRRREAAGDEVGRQTAENFERAKWGRQALEVVRECGLPLWQELDAQGLGIDAPQASRALRGLRAATLKKRVLSFRSFQR